MILRNPLARAVRYRDGLPVLPGAFPLVGHIPAIHKDAPAVFRSARKELGNIFWVMAGPGMHLVSCAGVDAIEIFRSKAFTNEHLEEVSPLVARGTLLAQEGAAHRHMRAAMNGPFAPRALSAKTVGPMAGAVIAERVARWVDRKQVRILAETRELALEIIFRLIGVAPEDLGAWREHYGELLLANLGISTMFPGSPAYRAARAKKWLDARFREIIAAARDNPTSETLVRALTLAKDDDGEPLTDQELVDNLRLLVLGGHETMAATLAWIVIMLGLRPDLWDALCAEAQAAASVPVSPQEARTFPFAEALFRETVRMYPPFGIITRRALADFELHGRRIPKGTMVGVDLWTISHDPDLFDDPETFLPSRWIGRNEPPSSREIVQFGAGPHFCLGYHLAWLESVQLAVALARELGPKGARPRVEGGSAPTAIFVPVVHPAPKTKITFT
jgi:cytochrome P450